MLGRHNIAYYVYIISLSSRAHRYIQNVCVIFRICAHGELIVCALRRRVSHLGVGVYGKKRKKMLNARKIKRNKNIIYNTYP